MSSVGRRAGMGRRKALAATFLGAAGVLSTTGVASAGDQWCEFDPAIVIETPAGNLRLVYLMMYGPVLHLTQLLAPTIECEVRSTDDGAGTRVRLDVTVRDDDGHAHAVRSAIWTGPLQTGQLLSIEDGRAGQQMRHRFNLAVP